LDEALKLPGPQSAHDAPTTNEPGAQDGTVQLDAPTTLLDAQAIHAACPTEGWYVPTSHKRHTVDPVTFAYDPGAHALHDN